MIFFYLHGYGGCERPNIYCERTLWHSNSIFDSSHRATSWILEQDQRSWFLIYYSTEIRCNIIIVHDIAEYIHQMFVHTYLEYEDGQAASDVGALGVAMQWSSWVIYFFSKKMHWGCQNVRRNLWQFPCGVHKIGRNWWP